MPWAVHSEALPLADLLIRTANRQPNDIALAFPDQRFTFEDLLERAVQVARGLIRIGVEPHDNVGLLAPNSIEFAAGMFGISMAGAVVVPLHVRSTSRELSYVISHSELTAVLTTDRIAARTDFQKLLGDALPGLADSDNAARLHIQAAPRLRRVVMLEGNGSPGVLGRTEFTAAARDVNPDEVNQRRCRVRVRDAAVILYTSGTTSNPKGCVLSHEAVTRGPLARIDEAFPYDEQSVPLVMWCPGPLFHIAALQGFIYCVGTGATFLTDVHLDGQRALRSIIQWQANSLWGMFMPALRALLTTPGFDATELSFVHSIVTVGPASELIELQNLFPKAVLVNGAGMSETTGWFCMSPRDDSPAMRAATAGKPVAGAEVRIVDPTTGADLPAGQRGELLVRTYTMLSEYYRDPERTDEAIDSAGWLYTGDLFQRLESGHFVYEGRLKDMLKVGGENVPAIEVEAFLCGHPQIRTAEVVGVPDTRLDEVPVAFVESEPGTAISEVEIIEYCSGRLATYKIPRAIYFLRPDEWPMSATKVNKPALRTEAIRRSQTPPAT